MPPWIPTNNWVYVTTTPATTAATTIPITTTTTTRMDETFMEEECEFQVGDVVRIKDRDKIPDDVYFGWDEDMAQWCGQEFVIVKITDQGGPRLYFQDASEEMKGYFWGTDMVELVSSIKSQKELSNEDINDWNTLMNQI